MSKLSSRPISLIAVAFTLAGLRAMPATGQTVAPQAQLWDAAKTGDTTAMSAALKLGANVDSLDTRTNQNGRRALNWAAWFDQPAAIRLLVARGAHINLGNVTGFTPLHHAAENGSLDAARVLLALGADRKQPNAEGLTPVDVARAREQLAVAVLLDSLPKK
ncbi:MAG: ankyrin repeat domain-containing protein [Gemmatimonadales bacterium]